MKGEEEKDDVANKIVRDTILIIAGWLILFGIVFYFIS